MLSTHSYLTKCHTKFLKMKKEHLTLDEALVLGDFAVNYQFLMQDETIGIKHIALSIQW